MIDSASLSLVIAVQPRYKNFVLQMPLIAEVHVIIMTPLLSFVIEPIRSIGRARLPCQRDLVSNQRLKMYLLDILLIIGYVDTVASRTDNTVTINHLYRFLFATPPPLSEHMLTAKIGNKKKDF